MPKIKQLSKVTEKKVKHEKINLIKKNRRTKQLQQIQQLIQQS